MPDSDRHLLEYHLGEAVRQRKRAGLQVESRRLAHIFPLGWAHNLHTGEYQMAEKTGIGP